MKLFELLVSEDDDMSGVQYLSLVKDPATQIAWEFFGDESNQHDCELDHHNFSSDELSVLDQYGTPLTMEMLKGAKITPVPETYTMEGFVSVPPITSNPREFDLASADGTENNSITRYIYVVDTSLGSPLIKTSRALCRKMILAGRVFSRGDINNLSQKFSSSSDSFKLVFRRNIYSQVDFFLYKAGKYCRHRWFQVEFPLQENESFEEGLQRIPDKAIQTRRAIQIGGAGRPFVSEWSVIPPMKTLRASAEKDDDSVNESESSGSDPIAFHMGLFFYKTRAAALKAEPSAKIITRVKLCYDALDYGDPMPGDMLPIPYDACVMGFTPVDVYSEYFEGSGEVVDKFQVRQNFAKVPEYIREVAERAVKYAEENGWGDCGTDVGKRRANDLSDPTYDASVDILTRMYSYGSRHKQDWEASKSFEDGCGTLMMASWGFSPTNYEQAMNWLEGEIQRATEMNIAFSKDEYQGDITAVVFVPEQKIYRWDRETNSPYWVFMSKDTIKKMLMKISRLKPKNLINLEHSGMVFSGNDVYTYENWLVGEDPEKDKSYEIFGRTFPTGTWLTTIHFRDKRLFEEFIVSNRTQGISLEGAFEEIPFNFQDALGEITRISEEQEDILEDQEMVEGIIELLLQVRDLENRKEMAKEVIKDFGLSGVYYDYDDFITRLGLTNFGFDFPRGTCWEGYEPYGTKIQDGREVPNCVPVSAKKEGFVYPSPGETEGDFISRCVDYVMNEGETDQQAALGKCYGMWERGSFNKKQKMGIIAWEGGVPIYGDEYEAKAAAITLGCSGAHPMEGGWVPCDSHEDTLNGLSIADEVVRQLKDMVEKMGGKPL
jgi:hypothetical protein